MAKKKRKITDNKTGGSFEESVETEIRGTLREASKSIQNSLQAKIIKGQSKRTRTANRGSNIIRYKKGV